MPMTQGVSQGSILGPLMLFLTFVNDLLLHIQSGNDMYADDTTLSASSATFANVREKLQVALNAVANRCLCKQNVNQCRQSKLCGYNYEAKAQ